MEHQEYLKRAAEAQKLPIELLQEIMKIEKDKQFMLRRHGVYQEIREIILKHARGPE